MDKRNAGKQQPSLPLCFYKANSCFNVPNIIHLTFKIKQLKTVALCCSQEEVETASTVIFILTATLYNHRGLKWTGGVYKVDTHTTTVLTQLFGICTPAFLALLFQPIRQAAAESQ